MNLTALACPKCGAEMRTYERSGIHVDQCGECRGIFLDRGELERLVDAEAAHYARDQRAASAPPTAAVPASMAGSAPAGRASDPWADPRREPPRDDRRDRGRGWDDDDDDWDDRRGGRGRGRRGGFLGDMFDIFD
jgi:Zn-finger nucleic acid-binding protein